MTKLRKPLNKKQAFELLKSIGALDTHREITGTEREHLVTLLLMTEPVEESNNQHSWTSTYHIGDKVYHCHYFPDHPEPRIEEYIKYKDKE